MVIRAAGKIHNEEMVMTKIPKTTQQSFQEFGDAVNELFLEICKVLWIPQLVEWLNEKLKGKFVTRKW